MKRSILLFPVIVLSSSIAVADVDPRYQRQPAASQPAAAQPAAKPAAEKKPAAKKPASAQLTAAIQQDENEVVTLERNACSGKCPVYKLTIYGSGKIVYEGREQVAVRGIRTANISPAKLSDLLEEIAREGYFSMKDTYDGYMLTDLPWVNTSVNYRGRAKTVKHYMGDIDTPRWLIYIENLIDETAGSSRWVN